MLFVRLLSLLLEIRQVQSTLPASSCCDAQSTGVSQDRTGNAEKPKNPLIGHRNVVSYALPWQIGIIYR